MTHEHDFIKDLDGQVTCSICGARDDEMVSKSQLKRIAVQNSYDIVSDTPTYRGFIPQLVEKELK